MIRSHFLPVVLAGIVLIWAGQLCLAQPSTHPSQDSLLAAIQSAADPSSAVAAYANAVSALGESVLVEQSYVKRMVDFGLPELAEAQALDLTRRAPADGVPWSVAAYMSARRGQNEAALAQIGVAVNSSPDDPFVQRTAGQLVAWYDTNADPSRIGAMARLSAESVRQKLKDHGGFADAYALSRRNLNGQPGIDVQPQTYAAAPIPAPQDYILPPSTIYDAGAPAYVPASHVSYPTYVNPYDYWGYASSYYQPWWPTSYLSSCWNVPLRVIGFRDAYRDHHYDRDRNALHSSGSNRNPIGRAGGPRSSSPPTRIVRGTPTQAQPVTAIGRSEVRSPQRASAPPPRIMPAAQPQSGMRSVAAMGTAKSRGR